MNAADRAIAFATAELGKPYQWGATGPNAFDCSGLVDAAYGAAGVQLGRTTYQQINDGAPVARADLQPGDLVFPDAGHVQLYVGAGKVIEAPHTGAFVQEVPLGGFWQARRVTAPGAAPLGTAPAGSSAFAGATATGSATASTSPALFAGFGRLGLELALGAAGVALVVLGARRFTG